MVPIEKAEQILAELMDELPDAFFQELNGGVCLLPEAKQDPDFPGEDLYILGEYCEDPYLGRSIVIYYGSIEPVCGDLSPLELRRELRDTLRHEFRHHVEALAGENGLDLEDEAWLADYLEEMQAHKPQRSLGRGPIKKGVRRENISTGGHGLTNRDLLKECYYFVGIHFALPK